MSTVHPLSHSVPSRNSLAASRSCSTGLQSSYAFRADRPEPGLRGVVLAPDRAARSPSRSIAALTALRTFTSANGRGCSAVADRRTRRRGVISTCAAAGSGHLSDEVRCEVAREVDLTGLQLAQSRVAVRDDPERHVLDCRCAAPEVRVGVELELARGPALLDRVLPGGDGRRFEVGLGVRQLRLPGRSPADRPDPSNEGYGETGT